MWFQKLLLSTSILNICLMAGALVIIAFLNLLILNEASLYASATVETVLLSQSMWPVQQLRQPISLALSPGSLR